VLEGKKIQLLKSGPAFPGAGRPGNKHLRIFAVEEIKGASPGTVGLLGRDPYARAST
jgi:hypothetical protein